MILRRKYGKTCLDTDILNQTGLPNKLCNVKPHYLQLLERLTPLIVLPRRAESKGKDSQIIRIEIVQKAALSLQSQESTLTTVAEFIDSVRELKPALKWG